VCLSVFRVLAGIFPVVSLVNTSYRGQSGLSSNCQFVVLIFDRVI
jgi:hypothetical protein